MKHFVANEEELADIIKLPWVLSIEIYDEKPCFCTSEVHFPVNTNYFEMIDVLLF